jgi:thiamine biosynthesis protein ThiI
MESIHATNAIVKLPIFRPLIAYDKQGIIDIAKDIDTYETSILPYEDCCTVFLPDSVVTRPKLHRIQSSEEALDTETLVQEALNTLDTVVVKNTDQFNFK